MSPTHHKGQHRKARRNNRLPKINWHSVSARLFLLRRLESLGMAILQQERGPSRHVGGPSQPFLSTEKD